MSLQIIGAAIDQLKPFERNKIARGLDYVGYVPGLGSVGGVARLIAGIAVMIFWEIKACNSTGTNHKNLCLLWSAQAGHEARRGLLEITWIFNLVFSGPLDYLADSGTYPQFNRPLQNDEEIAKHQTPYTNVIAGVIDSECTIAHGNYFYKDNSPRRTTHALHYSFKKYDGNNVIWRSVFYRSAPASFSNGGLAGSEGVVLIKGYHAEPPAELDSATYTIKPQPFTRY